MSRLARLSLASAGLVLAAALAHVYLLSSGPAHSPREQVVIPQSPHGSWDEVLARPAPIVVDTLCTGVVHYPKQALIDPAAPALAQFQDDGSELLVFAHLVRHALRGDVLIDSGLDTAYARPGLGHMRAPGSWFSALHGLSFAQAPGHDVHTQLASRGARLQAIYLTHLHADHAASLPSFPAQVPIFVGAQEPDDLAHHIDSGLMERRTLHELERGAALGPFEHVLDVYGDGSLWAISTSGHTRGHLSFLVNGLREQVLLTGDVFHTRWAFEKQVAASGADDEQQQRARRSARQISAFIARYPRVRVIFGHQFASGPAQHPGQAQAVGSSAYRP
jgi:N-acyl homoserine lactone hydrolase